MTREQLRHRDALRPSDDDVDGYAAALGEREGDEREGAPWGPGDPEENVDALVWGPTPVDHPNAGRGPDADRPRIRRRRSAPVPPTTPWRLGVLAAILAVTVLAVLAVLGLGEALRSTPTVSAVPASTPRASRLSASRLTSEQTPSNPGHDLASARPTTPGAAPSPAPGATTSLEASRTSSGVTPMTTIEAPELTPDPAEAPTSSPNSGPPPRDAAGSREHTASPLPTTSGRRPSTPTIPRGAPPTTRASADPTATSPSTKPSSATTVQESGSGQQVCGKFGSAKINDGRYLVQNDEWGADDGQCVATTANGFTVDQGHHHQTDGPAGFPSIVSGCWMGTCTTGTTLPRRIGELGRITSSVKAVIPAGARTNLAYDLWADPTPRRDGANTAAEVMIWLSRQGGVDPLGARTASISLDGATWDVWKGTNHGVEVVSYVRQPSTATASDLPLTDFLTDAVTRGTLPDSDYLTNIQAGFEPWVGGPGLSLNDFSIRYGSATSGSPSPSATASPRPAPTSTTTSAPPTPAPRTTTTPPTPSTTSSTTDSSSPSSWAMSGGLSGFQGTPWNVQNAEEPTAAPSPNVPGRQAIEFTLPGGGKRSEVQPSSDTFHAGTTFFGYSVYLAPGFAVNATSWQVIFQLHDGGTNGSPPVALEVGDGQLWFANAGNDHDKSLGPVSAGRDVVVQMRVSFDGAGKGTVSVWRDGRAVLSDYAPSKGTMVDGSDYLKTGIYRDPSESQPSTLYLNDLRIGPTLASVDHLAGSTSAPQTSATESPRPTAGFSFISPVSLLAWLSLRSRRRRRRSPAPRGAALTASEGTP